MVERRCRLLESTASHSRQTSLGCLSGMSYHCSVRGQTSQIGGWLDPNNHWRGRQKGVQTSGHRPPRHQASQYLRIIEDQASPECRYPPFRQIFWSRRNRRNLSTCPPVAGGMGRNPGFWFRIFECNCLCASGPKGAAWCLCTRHLTSPQVMHANPNPEYHRDTREPNIIKRFDGQGWFFDRQVRCKHDSDKCCDAPKSSRRFT